MRKIYVASSWRNPLQASVVALLRQFGHEVYDFKNPKPGNEGFHWSEVDRDYKSWTAKDFAARIATSGVARDGFALDKAALGWCDTCVLVLPCGRSAHLEAGYAAGQRKRVHVLLHESGFEPELMYLLCSGIHTSVEQVLEVLQDRSAFNRTYDENARRRGQYE